LAPMMRRAMRNLDDEDINDFDPAFFPKRVYRDGRGPKVSLMLTDSMPPDYRAAISRRRPVFDARNHQPHFAVVRDDAAHRRAVDAYEDRNKWLQDAWKSPSGQMQQAPDNGSNGDDEDDDDLSPRDAYIQRLQGAYRTPIGNGNGADAIEAQRRRWTREDGGGGRAPMSVTFGQHAPAKFPAKDAAAGRALADAAYREYCDRISNGWRK
jgi:hypothetical protein